MRRTANLLLHRACWPASLRRRDRLLAHEDRTGSRRPAELARALAHVGLGAGNADRAGDCPRSCMASACGGLWRASGVGHGIRRWEAACFAGGWFTLFIALVSPLHPLGQVLFSAPHGAARVADAGGRAAAGAGPADDRVPARTAVRHAPAAWRDSPTRAAGKRVWGFDQHTRSSPG